MWTNKLGIPTFCEGRKGEKSHILQDFSTQEKFYVFFTIVARNVIILKYSSW